MAEPAAASDVSSPRRAPTLDDYLRLRERPPRKPLMHHTWRSLLFLHWRVEPQQVRRTLPRGLFVDTFDGAAYVGLVPFFMRDIRLRGCPPLPGPSNFHELNLRTYVHDADGTPGVWFYSLDCDQPVAVWGARTFFHLPYRRAHMSGDEPGDDRTVRYDSRVRRSDRRFAGTYRLGDAPRPAEPGTLEFFLVERYLLFAAAGDGRLFSGRVHHRPYPLVAADAEIASCNLLAERGFAVDESHPDHACGSPGVQVEVFALERLAP